MNRLVIVALVGALCAFATPAVAGDWHTGTSLICADCHVMHGSQDHGYTSGGLYVSVGPNAPYEFLLRNEVNDLCLTCHDNQSFAPDVFGANGGVAMIRRGGGLNADPAHRTNDPGYDVIDGHTLWSTDVAPGGTYSNPAGLECVNCHSQHGNQPTQYRNLKGATLTYATGTNSPATGAGAKDVYQRVLRGYSDADIDYNEPVTTASAYGAFCMSCHTTFHGSGGSVNMGGASGGDPGHDSGVANIPWDRHPTADVNIGVGTRTFYSNLGQFNSHTNRVKVMDSQGLWNGTAGDNTVTPSCFSCHRSHGTKNGFGLIYMSGTGTVTEEGDDGTTVKELCRQCHIQG